MEFEKVLVKEDVGLCRCCHSEGRFKNLNEEYVWMQNTEVYAEMLQQCFNIRLLYYPSSNGINGAQQLICEDCIMRLREACVFRNQVLEAETKLSNMLGLPQTEDCEDIEVSIKVEDHNALDECKYEAVDDVKSESSEDIDIEEHGVTPPDKPGTTFKLSLSRMLIYDTWLSIKDHKSAVDRCRRVVQSLSPQLLPGNVKLSANGLEKRISYVCRRLEEIWKKSCRSHKRVLFKFGYWLNGIDVCEITAATSEPLQLQHRVS